MYVTYSNEKLKNIKQTIYAVESCTDEIQLVSDRSSSSEKKGVIPSELFSFNELDKSQGIMVWEPLSFQYEKNKDFSVEPLNKHLVSLYFCSEFTNNEKYKKLFVNLFVSLWNFLRLNKTKASSLLSSSDDYLYYFSLSCGLFDDN